MSTIARMANSPQAWNKTWSTADQRDWRAVALSDVYDRIVQLCPPDSIVVDFGGGIGTLAARLQDERDCVATVVEHNRTALDACKAAGVAGWEADLEDGGELPHGSVIVATEVLEHLTDTTRRRLLEHAKQGGVAFFSVPHDRLGPDECQEHTIKWTAKEFLDLMREYFDHCRVEVMGEFMLAVCGVPAVKQYRLSVCFPARDEAEDIAKTLASFRGVADQLVVGVDHRTTDDTFAICEKFCDKVFWITDPRAEHCNECPEEVPEKGVHFGHIRNECIDKCDGDWIFMCEAHEYLGEGQDVLLNLDKLIPEAARIAYVYREGNGQQWAFPWLFESAPDLRFKRATHNVLDYPAGTYIVKLPQVRTIHERVHHKELTRKEQRKIQNRVTLYRDWLQYRNENSLHYLGAEWREHDPDKAIQFMQQYLREPSKNGAMRYHTRLLLAKQLMIRNAPGDMKEAREVLLGAPADDWARTEHWVWLGDVAFEAEDYEEALAFYSYATTTIGRPPFTIWWIDLAHYAWIPAQRMAMTFGALGNGPDALHWAEVVLALLPEDRKDARAEAEANIETLKEAIEACRTSSENSADS